MGDVGEVAKLADHALTLTDEALKELADENERDRLQSWRDRWMDAVATADADAMDRLLAELRTEYGFRLPAPRGEGPDSAA